MIINRGGGSIGGIDTMPSITRFILRDLAVVRRGISEQNPVRRERLDFLFAPNPILLLVVRSERQSFVSRSPLATHENLLLHHATSLPAFGHPIRVSTPCDLVITRCVNIMPQKELSNPLN